VCKDVSVNRRLFLALPILVALAGCGGSSSTGSKLTNPNVTFSVDVTSIAKDIKTVNNGAGTVGSNQLTGTTTVGSSSATVEVLANVVYTNGSGPFFGLMAVTLADGSILTARMDGNAVLNSVTNVTAFDCKLSVVGGTGTYLNATGSGIFTGTRSTALGGAVHMDVQLNVK